MPPINAAAVTESVKTVPEVGAVYVTVATPVTLSVVNLVSENVPPLEYILIHA
jgi:hypothetical protein